MVGTTHACLKPLEIKMNQNYIRDSVRTAQ